MKKNYLDFRCATAGGLTVQDVLPSAACHPITCKPYLWSGRGNWKSLPLIPQPLLDVWQGLLTKDAERNISVKGSPVDASWDEIKQALDHINPDISRDEWVHIGMALHSKDQSETGLAVWNEWSAGGSKYRGERDVKTCWRSFKVNDGIGIGTLFHHATQAGWVRPAPDVSGMFGAVANHIEWPEPQPIPCSLLPVAPFDYDLLPMSLRGWVMDIAERMQCPPDFTAVGAMAALSSVIGRKVGILPKRQDDWMVIPNLWAAVVGRPGVMKSPALSETMKPLDRLACRR